jgi:hypothetical protein
VKNKFQKARQPTSTNLKRSTKGEAPMRKLGTALAVVSVLTGGIIAAPTLYAQSDQPPSGSPGDQRTMRGGMMGMMKQMSEMMGQCSKMMGSAGRGERQPGDQPKKDTPPAPENKG